MVPNTFKDRAKEEQNYYLLHQGWLSFVTQFLGHLGLMALNEAGIYFASSLKAQPNDNKIDALEFETRITTAPPC